MAEAFDPDKYLAEKTSPDIAGFDPDVYLSEKTGEEADTGLLGRARDIGSTLIGGAAEALDYPYAIVRQAAMSPKKLATGDFSGGLLDPLKQVVSRPKDAPTTAEVLEAYGVPEESEASQMRVMQPLMAVSSGEYEEGPGGEMVKTKPSSELGAMVDLGAGGEALGLLGKGAKKIADPMAKALRSGAEGTTMRQAGFMLKDLRANERKGLNEIGRWLRDRGAVSAGDSFGDVEKKVEAIRKNAGKELDSIYSQVTSVAPNLPYRPSGFSIARDSEDIIGAAEKALKGERGKTAAIKELRRHLSELESEFGQDVLDPKTANDIKGIFDKEINYSRRFGQTQPEIEAAYSAARKILENKIAQDMDYLGEIVGSPELSKQLRAANKEYGLGKTVESIAGDRRLREQANAMFSLTDKFAGQLGAAGGIAASAATGNLTPLLMAPAMAIGNKVARTYGPGLLAGGLDLGANILERTPEISGLVGRGAALTSSALNKKKKKPND